jgi:polar amino acid transport system substrate-binding protein
MKDSGITDVKQLEGKTIAAQSGTTGSDWARENIPNCTVMDLDEATACFAALQSGKAEAVSIDLPVAMDMVKNAYQDAQVIKETPTGEQLAITVNKSNTALQSAVNKALADMRADGTYQKIYDKWFTV